MKHVAPHRWAELQAGALSASQAQAMRSHAATCEPCRQRRDRVVAGMLEFSTLATAPSPELAWDSVRTQIHWKVAAQARAAQTAVTPWYRRRVWQAGVAIPTMASAAFAVWLLWPTRSDTPAAPAVATMDGSAVDASAKIVQPPVPLRGRLAKMSSGAVVVNGERIDSERQIATLFTQPVDEGATIATADASVDIQFGAQSAFALGPRSTAMLRQFNSQNVELVVDGTIDIEVAARAPEQRFVIVAGTRTVEVRGTQFRVVNHGEKLSVSCLHGRVVVADGHRTVDVVGGTGVELPPDSSDSTVWPAAAALNSADVATLKAATPVTLANAQGQDDTDDSRVIAIKATATRAVRVDGIDVGTGSMWLRASRGRHRVEAANHQGQFRTSVWVEAVSQATSQAMTQAVVREVDTDSNDGRRVRQTQLRGSIDSLSIAACVRTLTKQGLGGDGFVSLQIKVDEHGQLAAVNVVDSDVSASIAQCVRDVVGQSVLPAGPEAMWVERLTL
jgi:hypothetical protein